MLAHSVDPAGHKVCDTLLVFAFRRGKTLIEVIYESLAVGQEFLDHEPGSRNFDLARYQAQFLESFKAARCVFIQDAYEFCGLVNAVFVHLFIDLAEKFMQLGKVGAFHTPMEQL